MKRFSFFVRPLLILETCYSIHTAKYSDRMAGRLINVNRFQLWLQFGWNDMLWFVRFSRHQSLESTTQLLAETFQSQFIALY